MLYKSRMLRGWKLDGRDGHLGSIKEFYFDDLYWTIRYVAVETGAWLLGRQIVLSPYALEVVDEETKAVSVDVTKARIAASPLLENRCPISKRFEEAYSAYYGYPKYWSGSFAWGPRPNLERNKEKWNESPEDPQGWDPQLRGTDDVQGLTVQASDGELGQVDDFVIDDDAWDIRHLIIKTHTWWPGKRALISPRSIDRINWPESVVFVNLTRDEIKSSTAYSSNGLLEDALRS